MKKKEYFYDWWESAINKMLNNGMFYYTNKSVSYYKNIIGKECQCFINILEILRLLFSTGKRKFIFENVCQQKLENYIRYCLIQTKLLRIPNSQLKGKEAGERLFIERNITNCLSSTETEYLLAEYGLGLRVDLSGIDLHGINFRNIDLKMVNLEGTNLERTDLKKMNLETIDLKGANLKGGNLKGANLKGANLEGANLKGANLEGANLKGANLKGANLDRINLINFKRPLTQEDIEILLKRTSLDSNNEKICNINLSNAKLNNAKLNNACLKNVILTKACLYRAELQSAKLNRAIFLFGDLRETDLRGADLRGADLRGADLRGADLRGADLENAKLMYAKFDELQILYLSNVDITKSLVYIERKDIFMDYSKYKKYE